MPFKYGKRKREFLEAFLFPFQSSSVHDFEGFLITKLYEPRWLSIISYPTRAQGIIVKYPASKSLRMS